jgi:hypothetical protein
MRTLDPPRRKTNVGIARMEYCSAMRSVRRFLATTHGLGNVFGRIDIALQESVTPRHAPAACRAGKRRAHVAALYLAAISA